MKNKLIYTLICCIFFSFFIACEDDIEDATSKHVYGEDESPYLRTDADATVASSFGFEVGRFEDQTIKLTDYADKFQEKMGMTVDEVVGGLENGSVVFYNINVTKRNWDKTPMTKGATGWYYNSAGGITTAEDAEQLATLDFDVTTKTLNISLENDASAGTEFAINVGFAVNGTDYDNYVRFAINISVTDPSLIITSVSVPDGDYASYSINLADYADVIEYNMGVGVDDFLANLDVNEGGNIHMYSVNVVTGEWDETSTYTANPPGYWLNASGEVCSWGESGFSLYGEMDLANKLLNIGRAPALATGSTYKIGIGYRDTTDESKFFRFIINVTLE